MVRCTPTLPEEGIELPFLLATAALGLEGDDPSQNIATGTVRGWYRYNPRCPFMQNPALKFFDAY